MGFDVQINSHAGIPFHSRVSGRWRAATNNIYMIRNLQRPALATKLQEQMVEVLGFDPSREQSSTAEGFISPSCV